MKILLNPSDPVDELGEIRKVWFEMNKRIKKKLRKRFGRFHYRNISKMTLTVLSAEKGNDNFRILNKSCSGILVSGNGESISKQLCEHFSEIKDIDLLPRFSGDRIISVDLCENI